MEILVQRDNSHWGGIDSWPCDSFSENGDRRKLRRRTMITFAAVHDETDDDCFCAWTALDL